jgi:hypothetical protein
MRQGDFECPDSAKIMYACSFYCAQKAIRDWCYNDITGAVFHI